MPLIYKVKSRMHESAEQIYDHFKNAKKTVGMAEFEKMFIDVLGVNLTKEELLEVEAFIEQRFKTTELSLADLRQFFSIGIQHNSLKAGDSDYAKQTMRDIFTAC